MGRLSVLKCGVQELAAEEENREKAAPPSTLGETEMSDMLCKSHLQLNLPWDTAPGWEGWELGPTGCLHVILPPKENREVRRAEDGAI